MSQFPDTFYCSLTGQIMENPVIDPEGYNYEQSAIIDYLQKNKEISPVTLKPLLGSDLKLNLELKAKIDAIRSQVDDANRYRNLKLLKNQPLQANSEVVEEQKVAENQEQITGNENSAPHLEVERMGDYVRVKINTPQGTARSSCDICCVIDISGSMSSEVYIRGQSGNLESFGLTILDLVKHSVKTIIENLNEYDRLSLVSFHDDAQVLTELSFMNAEGKALAVEKLDQLEPLCSTNLWDGVVKGLDVMKMGQKNQPQDRKAFSQILLFTDGQPNVIPPRGHIPMLKKYKEDNPEVNCSLSTFGFGYNLDSVLLNDLAIEGKGSYAFIPDGSFVGTVFVNALSNLMTTMAVDATLCLENAEFAQFASDSVVIETAKGEAQSSENVMGGFDNQKVSWGVNANIGSLQFGQSRNIILRLKNIDSVQNKPYLTATLRYKTSSNAVKVQEISAEAVSRTTNENIAEDVFRFEFVETVKDAVIQFNTSQQESQEKVKLLIEKIKAHSLLKTSAFLKDLLFDITGQVTEALQTDEAFRRWGQNYLLSLIRAHQTQQCNNFKDPGVQHYGGKLFNKVRDIADEKFLKMPPPKPSGNPSSGTQINMQNFYCNSAPCFTGDSLVRVAGNQTASPTIQLKKVSDIRAGDMIISPAKGGIPARVLCVLRTQCSNNQAYLVELSDNLLITPYHPVRIDGKWSFPCDIKRITQLPCDYVYSFVLEDGHSMEIGGIECVTYAHGFTQEVVKHEYFGTNRIIDDLKQMQGWENGYITLAPNCLIRDPISRLVIGLKNNTNELNRKSENVLIPMNQDKMISI